MSKHSKIGVKGEQIAEDFLLKKGYIVLFKNWRAGKKEVDLVALDRDTIIMVEVKTRAAHVFGFPEEAVNAQKKQHLRLAAAVFLEQYPQYRHLRFDIVSVLMKNDNVIEIVHFEEAFY